jgi:hypothetical protein
MSATPSFQERYSGPLKIREMPEMPEPSVNAEGDSIWGIYISPSPRDLAVYIFLHHKVCMLRLTHKSGLWPSAEKHTGYPSFALTSVLAGSGSKLCSNLNRTEPNARFRFGVRAA